MSDPKIIKTAVELAEKELQEKEIERVKNIVKDYLKEISEKSGKKAVLDKEILLLKKDLDDFKAGRLDKIEERQKIEPLSPKIVIITRIEHEYVPARPWFSPFNIQYPIIPLIPTVTSIASTTFCGTQYLSSGAACNSLTLGGNSLSSLSSSVGASVGRASCINIPKTDIEIVGNVFKNFAGGAYNIGGNVINL